MECALKVHLSDYLVLFLQKWIFKPRKKGFFFKKKHGTKEKIKITKTLIPVTCFGYTDRAL